MAGGDEGRVRHPLVRGRLVDAEEAARLIDPRDVIGVSGFARAGSPKEVPRALARRAAAAAAAAAAGHPFGLTVFSGGSVGGEIDGDLAGAGALARRLPYQSLPGLRRMVNDGRVDYVDLHLGACPRMLRAGHLGPVDVALVEACAIGGDGGIIPTSSVGNTPLYVDMARRVIVELNLWHPAGLEGLHDIWCYPAPPDRAVLPLEDPVARIGRPVAAVDPDKIEAVVVTHQADHPYTFEPPGDAARRIGAHLLDFLRAETRAGRLPPQLPPLQTGIGNVGNAVLHGLRSWGSGGLTFYSEVLQDGTLDLVDAGLVRGASATSLALSAEGQGRLHRDLSRYKRHLVLRPQEVSNSGEAIRRLDVIAVNTAVEVDIHGHVNSTHVFGTRMLNGIGGSGDFSRNALLAIFVTPSTARDGRVSAIVPQASHVDHTEHEVSVVITEQGVADLRGLGPRERARAIISRCAHPDYRPLLQDYHDRACRRGGYSPHLLEEALSWHERCGRTGSMLGEVD